MREFRAATSTDFTPSLRFHTHRSTGPVNYLPGRSKISNCIIYNVHHKLSRSKLLVNNKNWYHNIKIIHFYFFAVLVFFCFFFFPINFTSRSDISPWWHVLCEMLGWNTRKAHEITFTARDVYRNVGRVLALLTCFVINNNSNSTLFSFGFRVAREISCFACTQR